MMREGCRLSYSARLSRRNSGLKRMRSVWNSSRAFAVYPTGIVDLMTIQASGLTESARRITASTAEVSKVSSLGS